MIVSSNLAIGNARIVLFSISEWKKFSQEKYIHASLILINMVNHYTYLCPWLFCNKINKKNFFSMLCCTLFFSFPTSVMAKKKHNKQVCSKFLKAIWKKVVWCSILCHICIDQFISKQVLSLLRVYDFSWLEMYLSIGIYNPQVGMV